METGHLSLDAVAVLYKMLTSCQIGRRVIKVARACVMFCCRKPPGVIMWCIIRSYSVACIEVHQDNILYARFWELNIILMEISWRQVQRRDLHLHGKLLLPVSGLSKEGIFGEWDWEVISIFGMITGYRVDHPGKLYLERFLPYEYRWWVD